VVRNLSDSTYSQGSKHRITVYFNGGLGNQLFQLAGGLAIAQYLHRDVVFSESEISRAMLNTRRQFAIGELLDVGELSKGFEKFSKKNLFRSLFHKDTNIYERDPNDNVLTRIGPNTQKVFGYFQDISIVSSVEDKLLKRFSQSQVFSKSLMPERLEEIGIHVRLGDYRTSQVTKKFHGLTNNSFFTEGAQKLRSKLGLSVVTLFSDEPERLGEIAEDLIDAGFLVKHHFSRSDQEDLIQMSRYQGLVISNSSYSWWAAWIATTIGRSTIVAPIPWHSSVSTPRFKHFGEEWIALERKFE